MFEAMDPNTQYFSKILKACREAFAPYNVIVEELSNGFLSITKKEQPEAAVDVDNLQPSTSANCMHMLVNLKMILFYVIIAK